MLHADVGCHNMVLDGQDHVRLIDFEGCSIDGEEATSYYEWFSYGGAVPSSAGCGHGASRPISTQTDIFAFGCAVYEIMTGLPPYHELATPENRRPHALAEAQYAQNQFPDVSGVPLGGTIRSCWTGAFGSMGDVMVALEAEFANLPAPEAFLEAQTTTANVADG